MRYLVLGPGKSGTTALARAIEQEATAPVEVFFEPKDLSVVPASAPDQGSIVAKVLVEHTKMAEVDRLATFDRTVFICRDPRDVMISRLLYRVRDMDFITDADRRERWLDAIRQKEADPSSISTVGLYRLLADISGLENQLLPLRRTHRKAMNLWKQLEGHDVHLLRYEEFVEGDVAALQAYLGLAVTSDVDVGRRYSRVARTRSSGDWKHWFTEHDHERARAMFGDYMDAFGYDDWHQPAERVIRAEHASGYVERIIELKLP